MNRRTFLQHTGACSLLAVGPAAALPAADLPNVRLSCNLYSFNSLLRSGEMTLEEVFAFCSSLGFDAVDPTAYYFPGYPDVPGDDYLHHIKRAAFLLGLDISGTGVRNDFSAPDPERRKADLDLVRAWTDAASRFGAPVLRVFSGRGVPEGHAREEVKQWVVEGLRACADYGARRGVMMVLQNHDDFLKTADQTLEVLDAVGSDWLALNLDIGSFTSGDDPYAEIARVAPRAVTWQIKELVTVAGRQVKTDLRKIVDIVREAGYRGYLPIETLGPGDPREKVPRFLDEVRQALA